MRPALGTATAARTIPVLGLDWDGTVSCYAAPLRLIATMADRVVIITLNAAITPEQAGTTLGMPAERVAVAVCPHHRLPDFPVWKAEQCVELGVSLLFDDEHRVIAECRRKGIMAIAVAEL